MKRLQRICAVLSLALILAAPVVAGDMQTGVVPQPPPPPPVNVPGCSGCGVEQVTKDEVNDSTLVDSLEQVALYILQGALSLF